MSTVSLRLRVGQVPWITENVLKGRMGGEEEGMMDKGRSSISKAPVICSEHTLSYQEEFR